MEDWELGFSEVLRGTVAALSENWLPVLVYVVVFTAIGSAAELVDLEWLDGVASNIETLVAVQTLMGLGFGLAGLLIFALTLIGQYFLWEAILRKAGFGRALGRHRYLAFVGQSLVILLGTAFGYLLFVIPGLIFGARWMIAPALLVSSDLGIVEAMRQSWNAMRGNTTTVVLALLTGWLIILLVGVIVGGISIFAVEAIGVDLRSVITWQAASQLLTVFSIAMAMFLYGRLRDDSGELTEVFA